MSQARKQTKVSHCHKQIAKTARGLAEANYDELMSHDYVYNEWKRTHPGCTSKQLRSKFVEAKWGLYVAAARATLALLLRQPIDEKVKEEIMEVLLLDSSLIRGRVNPATVAGAVVNKN